MRQRVAAWAAAGLVGGIALVAFALSPSTHWGPGGLKDAARGTGVAVGVSLSWHGLTETSGYDAMVVDDFTWVTLENATKWGTVFHTADGAPDPSRADALVRFAERAGLQVHGHPLVWDEHVPHWLPPTTPASGFQAAWRRFGDTVVARYAGRVHAWDVVNEALEDDGSLSEAPYFTLLGEGAWEQAFALAHAHDPAATLFYNDYAIEWDNARHGGALALLRRWLAGGVPVHGVGIQGHVDASARTSRAQWDRAIGDFAALGLQVHLSELDVRTDRLRGAAWGKQQAAAAALYDAVAACVAAPACTRVTFWGLTDSHSWLNTNARRNEATLRDQDGARKPAWFAVRAALLGDPLPLCTEAQPVALAGDRADLTPLLSEGLVWEVEIAGEGAMTAWLQTRGGPGAGRTHLGSGRGDFVLLLDPATLPRRLPENTRPELVIDGGDPSSVRLRAACDNTGPRVSRAP